jgi:deoxyadenosine/deoxycytidine kinase
MYAQVASQVPEPDLIIWLQATPATLMQRIRQRGIRMERGITEDYLQRLCDAYVEHFQAHAGAPVLSVVTEQFNPVERQADFERLLEALATFNGPRSLLNPAPDATLTPPVPPA